MKAELSKKQEAEAVAETELEQKYKILKKKLKREKDTLDEKEKEIISLKSQLQTKDQQMFVTEVTPSNQNSPRNQKAVADFTQKIFELESQLKKTQANVKVLSEEIISNQKSFEKKDAHI